MIPGIELDRTSGPQAVAFVATLGAVVVVAGSYVAAAYRRGARARDACDETGLAARSRLDRRTAWTVLGVIVALALALRLAGTGQSLSHPEMLVPGIDLPRRLSEPPARLSWMDTVWFHLHAEVHTPGYFLGMFAWTSLFGIDPLTIRLPSVLAGAGTVVVGYALAASLFGRGTGLLAALLLALHGLAVRYSAIAQHYALSSFLALSSLGLLWLVRRRSRWLWPGAAGYFLVTWLGLFTQVFFWFAFAAHFAWATLLPGGARRRVLTLLTLVAIVAMPVLAHTVYRGPELPVPRFSFLSLLGGWEERLAPVELIGVGTLTPSAVTSFLGFGFLFAQDTSSLPPQSMSPWWVNAALAPFLLVLVVAALRWPGAGSTRTSEEGSSARLRLVPFVVASMVLVAWFSRLALRRRLEMRVLILVSVALLAVPPLLDAVGRRLEARAGPALQPRLGVLLLGFASLGSFAVLCVLAATRWILAPRLELLFVLPLVLLAAGGARALARRRRAPAVAVSALLVALFAASYGCYRRSPVSVRDYKGLAIQMRRLAEPGDVLFVARDYATTPMFYYLDLEVVRPELWRRARRRLADPALRRFWTIELDDSPEAPEPPAGFRLAASLSSRRMAAFLFARDGPEGGG